MSVCEKELAHFIGSEQQHRYRTLMLTDGAKYLLDNGAGWICDVVWSYQPEKKFKQEPFQSWKFTTNLEKHECVVICTDGNDTTLATQHVPYTDLQVKEIKLYLIDGLLLLNSEY